MADKKISDFSSMLNANLDGADLIEIVDTSEGENLSISVTELDKRFAGTSTFVGLTDTPANYTGAARKISTVNAGETALEFIEILDEDTMSSDSDTQAATQQSIKAYVDNNAISTFVGLSDTPANYTSAAYKLATVNAGGTAVEFTALLDEDDMSSDSDTKAVTQQSIKAYVDALGVNPANVYTISASGADYTTIQAALTAQTSGGELFIVYPGTYTNDTINFTANNQVILGIAGCAPQTVVTQTDANVCDFGANTGCCVISLTMTIFAATTAIDTITGTGSCTFIRCTVNMSSSQALVQIDQPSCANGTGTILFDICELNYNHSGVCGGTAVKRAITLENGTAVKLDRSTVTINCSESSAVTTVAYGTGTGAITIFRSSGIVTDHDTAITVGTYQIGSGTSEAITSDLHVTNNVNAAYAVFITGTAIFRSVHSHLHILSAAGSAYSYNVGSGCTVNAILDDIIAADGYSNSGTLNVAVSEVAGDFSVTGNLNLPTTTGSGIGIINKNGSAFIHNYENSGTAGQNIFIGQDSGNFSLTGSDSSSEGSYNLCAGIETGNDLTVGRYNVLLGPYCGKNLDSGSENVAIGRAALYVGDNTSYNICIGTFSGVAMDTASYNVAIGYESLAGVTITGNHNLAFGYQSGKFHANGSTPLATPNNSIYLGAYSRGFDETDDNTIVIGYQAIGIGPNTVMLGNSSIVTTVLQGKVGVGLTPTANMTGLAIEAGVLTLKDTTTPTADAGYAKIYPKADDKLYHQNGAGVELELAHVDSSVGEMYMYEASQTVTINTASKYHAVLGFSTGDVIDFTFDSGRVVDANISAEANPSASVLRITTSAAHNLTTGDTVSQTGMNDAAHNGFTQVTVVDSTNYDCDDIAYVAGAGASAGVVDEGSYLEVGADAVGSYQVIGSISGASVGNGKLFKWELFKNATEQNKVVAERNHANTDVGAMPITGVITVVEGDRIFLACQNKSDDTDFTISHANINLHKL